MLQMNTASVIETLEDFVETVKPQFVKGSSRYLSTDVVPLAEALLRFEERYVREALIRTGGNRAAAATELGMTLRALTKVTTRAGITNDPAVARAPNRVLIVDDEEPVRKYVERVLGSSGYETTTAADGFAALLKASATVRFDLLVTDLMMPDMKGDELARRLRKADPRLKVLYLTGFSDHLFRTTAVLSEHEAFLDKPCGVDALREAVAMLMFGTLEPPASLEATR